MDSGVAVAEQQLAALTAQVRLLEAQVADLSRAAAGERALAGASEVDWGELLTHVWLIQAGAGVFFMQAGLALLEAGACRSKNVLSILTKNQVDIIIGFLAWGVVGWGVAFGDARSTHGLIGTTRFLEAGAFDSDGLKSCTGKYFFHTMICGVAATIVSGGIAERAQLAGYVLFSLTMCGFAYPTVTCWAWNDDGWLRSRGFVDFAGSGVVHVTGGVGALCGAWVLGPRAGRFGVRGLAAEMNEFAPHNVPFIVLGTMILWYGWYGFNAASAGSLRSVEDAVAATLVCVNTTASAVAGAFVACALQTVTTGRWDVVSGCNGSLIGLVSITGGCAYVRPFSASCIGAVGGVLLNMGVWLLERLHIDDPVSAFSVHGLGGLWGLLAVSLFHMQTDASGRPVQAPTFEAQITGAVAIACFSATFSLVVFSVTKWIGMSASSELEQRRGLDALFTRGAYGSAESQRYRAFISHSKASHGATARWLQLELGQYASGKSNVFLDSDNLVNLGQLLATVREKVDVLVVLASEDMLWRPWCAGEIAVADMAGVPAVVAMMSEGVEPLELDFRALAAECRSRLGQEQMDVLTPFGVCHEDVERAYERLADAPTVHLGAGMNSAQLHVAIEEMASLLELPRLMGGFCHRACGEWALKAANSAVESLPGLSGCLQMTAQAMRRPRSTYVILCNQWDVEAIAAMHICATALLEVQRQKNGEVDIHCCDALSEEQVLTVISQGAEIILVLSKGALLCRLVQRACIVKSKFLWPDGISFAVSDAYSRGLAVLVCPDRLGFEFPDNAFYESVLQDHPHLKQDGVSVVPKYSRVGSGGLQGSRWSGLSRRVVPAETEWSAIELPCREGEVACLLVAFYKLLLHQIALPLSTHGSWRTIQNQAFWLYERAGSMSTSSLSFDSLRSRTGLPRQISCSGDAGSQHGSLRQICYSGDAGSQHGSLCLPFGRVPTARSARSARTPGGRSVRSARSARSELLSPTRSCTSYEADLSVEGTPRLSASSCPPTGSPMAFGSCRIPVLLSCPQAAGSAPKAPRVGALRGRSTGGVVAQTAQASSAIEEAELDV